MKSEKNIDRLFQEKMKNLEAVPSSKVWRGIESKLQKKKRRVLPYWWLSGGVAALLIISLFLFPIINDNPKDIIIDSKDVITTTPEDLVKKVDTSKVNKSIIPQVFKEEESDIAKKDLIKKEPNVIATNTPSFIEKEENVIIDNKNEDKKVLPITEKGESVISLNKKIVPSNKNRDTILKVKEKKKTTLLPKKDFIAEVNKSKDLVEEKDVLRNWSVSPVFAVLSSSSFAGSSPLASSMPGGSTSGDNTYSYGVKVNYKMNSKWTIQTGIHVQKMSYSTKNNNSTELPVSSITAINSVSLKPSSSSYSFNANGLTNTSSPQGLMVFLTSNDAVINQSFDYIELPIEIKYNIFSGKKLSTHVVTGFSSLFLMTNKLSVKSENFSQNIGEVNNLNSINFSGNLGIDFDYYFDKHWTLNINPMIKTQLSTFSENTGNFKPYSIGVYSGIKYSF
tara:strand:- start:21253 stop:22602 length:1350 start_codon:yes stop_codon:yes gene_type:complete